MNKSTTWNLFVLYHKKTKENVDGEVTVCVIDIRSILGDPGAVSRFQVGGGRAPGDIVLQD